MNPTENMQYTILFDQFIPGYGLNAIIYWHHSLYDNIQWSLFISTTLYLEHLSVSNYLPGPWNISTKYTLIFSLYLELLSISNKNFGPVATILSLSRTFYLHDLRSKLITDLVTVIRTPRGFRM